MRKQSGSKSKRNAKKESAPKEPRKRRLVGKKKSVAENCKRRLASRRKQKHGKRQD